MKKYLFIILFLSFGIVFNSCSSFEKEVDLNLPKFQEQIQVECYLENIREGCVIGGFNIPVAQIRAAISKSQNYYGNIDTPFVNNTRVYISYNGRTIELTNNQFPDICDTSNVKLFNYKNYQDTFNLRQGTEYSIKVESPDGKVATSSAKCLNFVQIDTLKQTYDAPSNSFAVMAEIKDDPAVENYYRIRCTNLTKTAKDKILRDAILIDGIYNGRVLPVGLAFNELEEGDTIETVLYHVTKEYYRFYRTVSQAGSAAGNPFSSPTFIEGNINGGLGIFACLPGTKKRMVIKK